MVWRIFILMKILVGQIPYLQLFTGRGNGLTDPFQEFGKNVGFL
jgi:hypothetical protein